MASINERYNKLRKRLNDLNYTDAFGVDAVELVERLLQELGTYKSSISAIKERENKSISDASLAQAQLFPLRKENAKLVRENNELHLDHIRQVEHHRNEIQKYQKQLRDLSDEVMQFQMLYKATKEELVAKEQMVEKLRDAYEGLVDPALKVKRRNSSIKQTGKRNGSDNLSTTSRPTSPEKGVERDGGSVSSKGSRTTFSKNSLLSRTNKNPQQVLSQENQMKQVMETLQRQLETAMEKNKQYEVEVNDLKTSIASREQELARANQSTLSLHSSNANGNNSAQNIFGLKAGGNSSATDIANKRIIDQLNSHVDFLNEQLAFRESQIKELHNQIQETDAVKMELNSKNSTLERLKDENAKLTGRLQSMEKKLFALGTPNKSPKVSRLLKETMLSQDSLHDVPGRKEEISTTLGLEATGPSTPLAGERVKFSSDTALIMDLNKEIEKLQDSNSSLMKTIKEYENVITNLRNELEVKERAIAAATALSSAPPSAPASPVKSSTAPAPSRSGSILVSSSGGRRTSVVKGEANNAVMVSQLQQEVQNLKVDKEQQNSLYLTTSREKANLEELLNKSNEDLKESKQKIEESHAQTLLLHQQISDIKTEKERLFSQIIQIQNDQLKDREIIASLEQEIRTLQMQQKDPSEQFETGREREEEYKRPPRASMYSTTSSTLMLQNLQQENDILRKTVDRLQSEVLLLEERFHEAQSNVQVEGDEAQSLLMQLNATKSMVEEQRKQYQELQSEYFNLETAKEKFVMKLELIQKRQQYDKSQQYSRQSSNDELIEQVNTLLQEKESLQHLIDNHQHHTEIISMKVTHLQQLLSEQETTISSLQQEKEKFHQELIKKQQEHQQLKDLLRQLDEDRDQTTTEYETIMEEYQLKQHQYEEIHQKLSDSNKIYQSLQTKYTLLSDEYSKLMNYHDKVYQQYTQQQQEIIILKKQLQTKIIHENHSSEDLLLMTKENQAITNELSLLSSKYDTLYKQYHEINKQLLQKENEKKIIEIEKNDLLNNYRILMKEKQKLEDDITAMSQAKTEEYFSLQNLQKQIIDYQHTIEIHQHLEEKWSIERSSLLNQIELFTNQITQLQKKSDQFEEESRRLQQELHNWKQTNAMLNERLSIIMKRATAASDSNKVLTTRLGSVERERDGLRSLLDMERQKSHEMLKIAEMAKIESANKDVMLQRLRGETTGVRSPPTEARGATPPVTYLAKGSPSPRSSPTEIKVESDPEK